MHGDSGGQPINAQKIAACLGCSKVHNRVKKLKVLVFNYINTANILGVPRKKASTDYSSAYKTSLNWQCSEAFYLFIYNPGGQSMSGHVTWCTSHITC